METLSNIQKALDLIPTTIQTEHTHVCNLCFGGLEEEGLESMVILSCKMSLRLAQAAGEFQNKLTNKENEEGFRAQICIQMVHICGGAS